MVVAQFAKRLPPTLEVRGSNPPHWQSFIELVYCIHKTKIKKKSPGMAHLKNVF